MISPGKAPCERASPGRHPSALVIQLEGKLNLPRIVRSIARGPNLTKVIAREVAGTGNRHHSVASEVRRIEVRMVEDVEELGPELHGEPIVELYRFEQ